MSHLNELCETGSKPEKLAVIQGFLCRWTDENYPLYISLYLEVLLPIHRLSASEQKEEHDPVKAVKRIKDFSLMMNKLQTFIDSSQNDNQGTNKIQITHFNKIVSKVPTDEDGNENY